MTLSSNMLFMLPVIFIILLLSISMSIYGLSTTGFRDSYRQKRFTFSDNPTVGTTNTTDDQVLTRQLITNVVPGLPSFLPNLVVTPTSYCICVPPGSCANPIQPPLTDGTGQIDIRIVNNGGVTPTTIPFTCQYGLVGCCQAGTYQCGRRYPPPPGSIPAQLGQADFGEYPWQAAILTTSEVYLGSGALVTAQHILTAAHKVYNISPTTFKVRLGEWDASNTLEPIPAQDFAIANVYIHPNFNKDNLQNDVAILRLATPVSLGTRSTIATICLPTLPFVGQRCYVAGWGKNDFGPAGAYQAVQREVDVPLIPNADCQAALRNTRLSQTFVLSNSSFVCAGGEAGKDACTGDGGSPLVCQNNNIWYVVGMVAWGIGCAVAGVPGVYVNVATYLPWIQAILAT